MSEPHYRSAVTGDLVPESELVEIPVYEIRQANNRTFDTDILGTAHVDASWLGDQYNRASVLTLFDDIVTINKDSDVCGRVEDPDDLSDEMEVWENVVSTALNE